MRAHITSSESNIFPIHFLANFQDFFDSILLLKSSFDFNRDECNIYKHGDARVRNQIKVVYFSYM